MIVFRIVLCLLVLSAFGVGVSKLSALQGRFVDAAFRGFQQEVVGIALVGLLDLIIWTPILMLVIAGIVCGIIGDKNIDVF